MHVARGGWLGQTYALAKYDDSFEGKKSGIRRSKEERKGMVETFIKRYQKSNNGDFPSLNLTRKEVGGSFYTVREIVREIIQENRVLGPPKSSPGDQSMDNLDSFLEHSPLGSLSVNHNSHSLPLNDTQTLPEYEVLMQKALTTVGPNELHQEILENDNIIGKEVEKHSSGEEIVYVETSQLSESDVVETSCATVSNGALEKQKNADLLVKEGTGEQKDNMNEVVTKDIQNFKNSGNIPVTSAVTSAVYKNDEKYEEKNAENMELETESNRQLDVNGSTSAEIGDTFPAQDKTVNGSNFQSNPSFNSVQHRTLDDRSASASSQNRRTNPTLNRINLESWKAASRKSYGRETHQIVKFIRSFITAFVKFWTE
ncbi:uncharacterized protein [Rutidosis leptorrhynchoides]|uniref:uncharacterized protein isoform X2 n=1 Tax=Rutidosis leptorrhynchoides TaxID=125765 RepID=UPI003A9A1A74